MKRLLALLVGAMCLAAVPARAFVAQTITVDGVNDFDPANLLDDDRADTQFGCGPTDLPMDIGRVYVTNDANFLYLGIEFTKTCYCDIDLGMAIDVNTPGGGTTDPFGRKIGWANVPFKPDWVIYDVTPTNCNTFNYEVLYKDSLGTWLNRSTLINPAWGSGANGLGIIDSTSFRELKIPLTALGLVASTPTPLHLEFWLTQEGATKGPLDAMCSDNVQMSRVGTTTYDTSAVVQMSCMASYVLINAVDNVPPTVVTAQAVNFATLANKQFNLLSNKVDVAFSEPVDLTTSQTAGNYVFGGAATRTVISAVRDGVALNVVHLTLNSPVGAAAGAYTVTVSNVKDPANNVVVTNGTTNVGGFFLQNVTFNADFHLPLCGGTFAPTDTFAVEGSVTPLSFALCDNAFMTDGAPTDSIYSLTAPFCLLRDRATGKGSTILEWKLTRNCSQYEGLSGNRVDTLRSDNGANFVKNVVWNNDVPANYTTRPVDVIFKVDATRKFTPGTHVITLLGDGGGLSFTQPGVPMLDNGVAPDQVAGDHIYTVRYHFPACSPKNIGWKVDFDGTYECAGQGNRTLFLNDAVYSAANPLVLPARGIDRCEVTDKPITVVFKLNTDRFSPAAGDSFAVMGDQLPLRFDYPQAAALMLNDGAGFDAHANDIYWTRAVTFPDSTRFGLQFKYWKNGVFECEGFGNRTLTLDDVNYSTGSPLVRLVNLWDFCSDPSGVPATTSGDGASSFATLRPVMPNPVVRGANFAFDLHRAGHVTLSVYDVTGRRVARLVDAPLTAGLHTVAWDGTGDAGLRMENGVYLYELAMGGQRVSRRLILIH